MHASDRQSAVTFTCCYTAPVFGHLLFTEKTKRQFRLLERCHLIFSVILQAVCSFIFAASTYASQRRTLLMPHREETVSVFYEHILDIQ